MALSSFASVGYIPLEEKLEIPIHKSALHIGIPKERYYQEKRIALTPDSVQSLVNNGHRVLIESDAGENATFSDADYIKAGAEITTETDRVFKCPILLKVEPLSDEELNKVQPKTIVISALQIKTRNKEYFEKLSQKKVIALAFEYIQDVDGCYPAVRALSEIAGTASVLIASELMANTNISRGMLFGNITGVRPTEVLILGAGTVAEYAAKTAIALGASVKVFDNNITKLRRLQTNLGTPIYTSTLQQKTLLKALMRCDVAIGAKRGNTRAPILVTQTMMENMKKGAVIVDVSIDTGGCFESSEVTTHEKPTFIKNDVIHYCVPNIPSRYARTASMSISNMLEPILLEIAENGGVEKSIAYNKGIREGVYCYSGILTKKNIADWFGLEYRDLNLLLM
nr:alanine dehydrogenase [uncultured Flavobacterium sp.]